MDRDELARRLQSLSDEDLVQLMEKTPENHETVSTQLPDGTTLEAANQEELNKLLVAKLGEYRERDEEVAPPPPPQQMGPPPVKWDYKKFQEKFIADPRDGMEYMETSQYGMPTSKLVPLLVNAMGNMAKKMEELEAQDFINSTPEYEPSVENRKAVEKLMLERNWKPSRQTFADAFDIAKSRGLVKTREDDREESKSKPFIAPRIKRTTGHEETLPDSDLIDKANAMSMKDLEKVLMSAGVLKLEHV
jgi:hypothetical protein